MDKRQNRSRDEPAYGGNDQSWAKAAGEPLQSAAIVGSKPVHRPRWRASFGLPACEYQAVQRRTHRQADYQGAQDRRSVCRHHGAEECSGPALEHGHRKNRQQRDNAGIDQWPTHCRQSLLDAYPGRFCIRAVAPSPQSPQHRILWCNRLVYHNRDGSRDTGNDQCVEPITEEIEYQSGADH
jgi:hypothetical protein